MRKITTLLTFLLLCIVGAKAQSDPVTIKVNFGYQYGTFYKKGKQANNPGSKFDKTIAGATSPYCNKWISADETGTNLTMQYGIGDGSSTENNFEMNNNAFCVGSSSHVINVSVADGFVITGYVIKGKAREGSITITPAAGGEATTFTTAETATLVVSGLSTTTTSLTLSGDNKYVEPEEFYFTVEERTSLSIGTSTGTFYNNGTSALTPQSSLLYASKWVSTSTTPQLSMTCKGNNMIISTNYGTSTHMNLHGNPLTYTLSVDGNYYIRSYSITGYASNGSSKINGTTVGTTEGTATTVTKSGLNSSTATFEISGTANPWMYITNFTVELVKLQTASEVTYTIKDVDGNTLATEKKTESWGDPAAVSSTYSYDAYTYTYNPATIPTEETADIEVTVSPKAITDIAQFSNNKAYSITTKDRGAWYVPTGGTQVTSTKKEEVSRNPSSATQQFAFIEFHDRYYLYSVSENKFVAKSGDYTMLTDDATQAEVYLQTTPNALAPVVVTLSDGSQLGVSNNYTPAIISFYNDLSDQGNQAVIQEAGDFDPTNVIATLDANFGYVTFIIEDSEGNELERKNNVLFAVGDVVNALPDEMVYDYTDYAGTDITVQAGSNTYKTTATFDQVPFQVSTEDVINWYKLKINNSRYIYANTTNTNVIQTTTDGSTDYYYFAIYGNPISGFTIKNKGKDLYINGIVTTGNGYSGQAYYSETASPFGIKNVDESTFRFTINSGVSPYRLFAMGYYSGYSPSVTVWTDLLTTNDGKLTATLVKSEGVANVTYIVQDVNGVEKARYTKKESIGSTLNESSMPNAVVRDYCSYTADEIVVVTGENTFTATATYNTPFEISTDFDNAHWYFWKGHSNSPYTKYIQTVENATKLNNTIENKLDDSFKWAFIGNPYDGFKIVNRATGGSKFLLYSQGDAGDYMDESGSTWRLCKSNDTWFGFANDEVPARPYLNTHVSSMLLKTWSQFDAGSQFCVEDIPEDPYYDEALALVTPWLEAAATHAGENFQLASSGTALMNFGTALNSISANHENDIQTTRDEYQNLNTLLQAAIVLPETGLYRLKNNQSNTDANYGYMGLKTSGSGGLIGNAKNPETDASTIIRITKSGNSYSLATQGAFGNVASMSAIVSMDNSAHNFMLGAQSPGVAYIQTNPSDAYSCYHAAKSSSYSIVGWKQSSEASGWVFEDAEDLTITLHDAIDGNAYATAYLPFDIDFSGTAAKAYTVTRGETVEGVGSEAMLTEVTGVVPAGTPVVLIADGGTASVTAPVSLGATALGIDNILSGHYNAGTIAEESLVFGQTSTQVGFFRMNDYTTVLAANRAFIAPEEASSVRALVFVDPTTGISSSLFNTENGTTYDLSGRRVNNTSKGLYILNGKKVLVK